MIRAPMHSRNRRVAGAALGMAATFAGLQGLSALLQGPPPLEVSLAGVVLGSLLCWGAAVDLLRFEIPDGVSLGLFPLGLFVTWHLAPDQLVAHLAAGLAGGGLILAVNAGYRAWRGEDGLGIGDAKLLASGGAWLGPAGLPGALLFGCLSAIAALVVFARTKDRRHSGGRRFARRRLPFGPHLALGIWIIWVFGPLVPAG